MRFEGESKLAEMREYYENAVSAAQGAFEEFTMHRAQYRGDNAIDGSSERAAFCRNVTLPEGCYPLKIPFGGVFI